MFFYVSRTFDSSHAKFQRNFRVQRSLIIGWSFLGFPTEVHFYNGERECDTCGDFHPIYRFRTSPDSESDEQIQSALDIARRNATPPR